MRRDGVVLAVAACALLGALGARGDEPTQEPAKDPAQAAFTEGLAHYEAGRHLEAASAWERLRATLGEDRGWKIAYNLGLAYQAAGELGLAVERYEAFLAHVAAHPNALGAEIEERREDAAARVRRIKTDNGALVVRPSGNATLYVRIDAAVPRAAGFVAYLRPGPHAVEIVDAVGAPVRLLEVRAEAGLAREIDVVPLGPPAPAAPATAAPAPPPTLVLPPPPARDALEPAPSFPTAWVIAGSAATLLGFALPIALGVRASDLGAEAEALGAGHTRYAAARDAYDDARSAYELSYLLPAALAGITLGIATVGLVRIATHEPRPAAAVRF
jgi:tetratricopeptide (TPR) repeat protein